MKFLAVSVWLLLKYAHLDTFPWTHLPPQNSVSKEFSSGDVYDFWRSCAPTCQTYRENTEQLVQHRHQRIDPSSAQWAAVTSRS